jgi:hypothetical protein
MKEKWKTIPGFPDYKVSTLGRVWSVRRIRKGSNRFIGGCFLAPNSQGRVTLYGKKSITPARLMLMTFVRLPRRGECALHKDDVQSNNVLSNLYWGTKKANYYDALRNGRKGLPTGRRLAIRNKKLWKKGVYANAARKQWETKRRLKGFI